jgi:hypothetical protein
LARVRHEDFSGGELELKLKDALDLDKEKTKRKAKRSDSTESLGNNEGRITGPV